MSWQSQNMHETFSNGFWKNTRRCLLLLQNTRKPVIFWSSHVHFYWRMTIVHMHGGNSGPKAAFLCLKQQLVCWNRHCGGAGTLLWSLLAAEWCSCCCKCSFPLALSAVRSLLMWCREVSAWWISGSEARPGVHFNFSSAWRKMLASPSY